MKPGKRKLPIMPDPPRASLELSGDFSPHRLRQIRHWLDFWGRARHKIAPGCCPEAACAIALIDALLASAGQPAEAEPEAWEPPTVGSVAASLEYAGEDEPLPEDDPWA